VLRIADEAHELVVLPPVTHVKLEALEQLERFVAAGGRVLGLVFLPDRAFGPDGTVDVAERVEALFGVDPRATQAGFERASLELVQRDHEGGGRTAFLHADALARRVPRGRRDEVRYSDLEPGQHAPRPGRDEVAGMSFVVERGDYFEPSRHVLIAADGARRDVSAEVAEERAEVTSAVAEAIGRLIEPDVVLENDELFCLHRVKDDRDVYFVVNPTGRRQDAQMSVPGEIEPLLWDPSTGGERPIAPSVVREGRTHFDLALDPVGSAFVLSEPAREWRVVEADVVVDAIEHDLVRAHGEGSITVERAGERRSLSAPATPPPRQITLEGAWQFEAEDGNALVIRDLRCRAGDGGEWLAVVPGAWQYQQPAEPEQPYPFAVSYEARFNARDVPTRCELIVDGFAGSEWSVEVNGEAVASEPRRSRLDSQMAALDIASLLRAGENVLGVRLVLTRPTDGLLDLVKLVGDFAVVDGALAPTVAAARPDDWTRQGFPYYSGIGVYRHRVELPELDGRVLLEADAGDDALEVRVNGETAGVRLWAPYALDVGHLLQPGENELELRVANTPVNLLEGHPRRSGLTGTPRLVAYAEREFLL